jgi:hypothetical protein
MSVAARRSRNFSQHEITYSYAHRGGPCPDRALFFNGLFETEYRQRSEFDKNSAEENGGDFANHLISGKHFTVDRYGETNARSQCADGFDF